MNMDIEQKGAVIHLKSSRMQQRRQTAAGKQFNKREIAVKI